MSRATTAVRIVLVLLGLAALIRGGWLVLTIVTPSQLIPTAIWLAAGIVVHDAVIAPVTLLLGRLVRPAAALRFAWLASACVVLLAIPLIEGAKVRQNPTVIPGRPGLGLAISLGAVAAGTLLGLGWSRWRRPRRAPVT